MSVPASIAQWKAKAEGAARPFDLDPQLILAIIWVESDGNMWATRYERRYQYFVANGKPLYQRDLPWTKNREIAYRALGSTEFHLQSMSYGLMQVMGAVAREHGLRDDIPRLYDPDTNLKYGCAHFAAFMTKAKDLRSALLRYNGGGNESYPEIIFARLLTIQREQR